jgi:signal transduction histidine kinase
MKKNEQKVAQRYATILRHYVTAEQEADLEAAYDVGREAIAGGLGVLDMARVHLEAGERLLRSRIDWRSQARISRLAGTFYLQSLSPFEATVRGFNGTNAELAKRNRELEAEIAERRRAEAELRKSKDHYRELFGEARLMEENLRNLSNQVLHAQEEERRRISRELHDEIGQAMTAISINIEALRHSSAKRAEFFRREIAKTQGLLQRTMEMVHRFARELRPAMLDELGLLPALRSHLKSFKARTGLRVRFSADGRAEQLNNDQKTAVFRVAQESLNNVAKHARATGVNISIRQVGGELSMEITDDGRSFRTDPAAAGRKKQRLGLLGMQERARLLGGRFSISPAPDRGTVVQLSIPVKFQPQRTKQD